MMVGGRLNFSTGDSGQMFCPLQVVENEPIQYADLTIQYDTGKKETIKNKLKLVTYLRFIKNISFLILSTNSEFSV